MLEGIYRVYRRYVDETGRSQARQVARFIFYGDSLTGLEDHDGIIESLAPDGKVTGRVLARLESMDASPYWDLVHEDAIQGGEHEHLLPEVDDAGPGEWPRGA